MHNRKRVLRHYNMLSRKCSSAVTRGVVSLLRKVPKQSSLPLRTSSITFSYFQPYCYQFRQFSTSDFLEAGEDVFPFVISLCS